MRIQVIQTSLRGSDSASRKLVEAYLETARTRYADIEIAVRDLAAQPIPHLPAELIPVQLGLTQDHDEYAKLAEELISELERADIIVIGAAFYNFMISSSLKAWTDYITRSGRTFTYKENGPVGLLPRGKKLLIFVASGGIYSDGPAQQLDLAVPYLRTIFGFLGINDVEVVRAEAQANPIAGAQSLATAVLATKALV